MHAGSVQASAAHHRRRPRHRAAGSIQQSEQPACAPGVNCGRLQARVVKQVLVAADDRLGFCVSSQRNQIVIIGIAQQGGDLRRVIELLCRLPNAGDYALQVSRVKALLKISATKCVAELLEQLGADNRVKFEIEQRQ